MPVLESVGRIGNPSHTGTRINRLVGQTLIRFPVISCAPVPRIVRIGRDRVDSFPRSSVGMPSSTLRVALPPQMRDARTPAMAFAHENAVRIGRRRGASGTAFPRGAWERVSVAICFPVISYAPVSRIVPIGRNRRSLGIPSCAQNYRKAYHSQYNRYALKDHCVHVHAFRIHLSFGG